MMFDHRLNHSSAPISANACNSTSISTTNTRRVLLTGRRSKRIFTF